MLRTKILGKKDAADILVNENNQDKTNVCCDLEKVLRINYKRTTFGKVINYNLSNFELQPKKHIARYGMKQLLLVEM